MNLLIGGMQAHQSIKTDGICTCLTSSMGMGGGYIPMVVEKGVAPCVKENHGTVTAILEINNENN